MPPWVSPLCLVPEKIIWNLGLSKSPGINFLDPLKVNINIVYFNMNFFHFTKKFFLLLTIHAFFRNILQQHIPSYPNDISY